MCVKNVIDEALLTALNLNLIFNRILKKLKLK